MGALRALKFFSRSYNSLQYKQFLIERHCAVPTTESCRYPSLSEKCSLSRFQTIGPSQRNAAAKQKKKSQYTFPRAEKKRETIGIGGLIHSLLDRCALGWDFIMQRSLQQMNIYSTFRGSALDAF